MDTSDIDDDDLRINGCDISYWLKYVIILNLITLRLTTDHYSLILIICICFCALHIAATVTGVDQSGRIFVAVYMFFFATLLFVFEGVQIRSMEALDHVFRRNFGFLYNVMGKSFFIIL